MKTDNETILAHFRNKNGTQVWKLYKNILLLGNFLYNSPDISYLAS